jgi:hypothetical protein
LSYSGTLPFESRITIRTCRATTFLGGAACRMGPADGGKGHWRAEFKPIDARGGHTSDCDSDRRRCRRTCVKVLSRMEHNCSWITRAVLDPGRATRSSVCGSGSVFVERFADGQSCEACDEADSFFQLHRTLWPVSPKMLLISCWLDKQARLRIPPTIVWKPRAMKISKRAILFA